MLKVTLQPAGGDLIPQWIDLVVGGCAVERSSQQTRHHLPRNMAELLAITIGELRRGLDLIHCRGG